MPGFVFSAVRASGATRAAPKRPVRSARRSPASTATWCSAAATAASWGSSRRRRSRAALSGGARVTGIIPNFLFEREPPADNLTELITVEDFSSRKRLMMERADAFVVLPGGIGTLEEAFEVLTNLSIGRLQKPIGFLDLDGYYRPLLAFLKKSAEAGFVDPSLFFRVVLAPRPEELLSGLLARLSHEAPAKTRS